MPGITLPVPAHLLAAFGIRSHLSTGGSCSRAAQVTLPIWLATLLALSQSLSTSGALVTLDLPPALSSRVMNALKADPRTVDLRALAPHFFGLGARMLELFEEEEWVEVLSEVCVPSIA